MRNIQPINIWSAGEILQASALSLYISFDDLSTRANLIYQLCTTDGACIAEGSLSIDGQTYLDWGASGDSNSEAYTLAAAALNLTLI